MHYTSRAFIGQSSPTFWSQYWENEPDDLTLRELRGHLFGLITLTPAQPDDDLHSLGRSFIEEFDRHYHSQSSSEVAPAIAASVDHLLGLAAAANLTLTLNLAVVQHQQLFLFLYRSGNCLLFRQGQTSTLISATEAQLYQMSGPLLAQDRLFFVSHHFLSSFTPPRLKSLLVNSSLENIEESLLAFITNQADQSHLSSLLLEVHFDEGDAPTIPPPSSLPSTDHPGSPSPRPRFRLRLPFRFPHPRSSSPYITDSPPQVVTNRRRLHLLFTLILLLGLVIVSIYSQRRNQAATAEKTYQTLKSQIIQKISEGRAIKSLELTSAATLAQEARQLVTQIQSLRLHQDEVQSFSTDIEQLLTSTGSNSITPESYYDTSLITPHPRYHQLLLDKDILYLFSAVDSQIVSLNLDTKAHAVISQAPELRNYSRFLVYQNAPYVFNAQNLARAELNNLTSAFSFDSLTPIDIQVWQGTLYLLEANNIWKLTSHPTGFNPPQKWLLDERGLNSPVSLTINGKIWVLSTDGQITPYLRGKVDSYSVRNRLSVTAPRLLATTPDTETLLLQDGDSLIYLFGKNGSSLAKYDLGQFKIVSLALDPQGKFCFLLGNDQKIYRLNLNSP